MAKKLSAERVSPITRANYSGKDLSNSAAVDDEYDPLTALANMVGNGNEGENEMEMEAELLGGMPEQPADAATEASHSENVISNQVFAQVDSIFSPDTAEASEDHGLATGDGVEPGYAKPVLQSFEELHTAFAVPATTQEEFIAESAEMEIHLDPAESAISAQVDPTVSAENPLDAPNGLPQSEALHEGDMMAIEEQMASQIQDQIVVADEIAEYSDIPASEAVTEPDGFDADGYVAQEAGTSEWDLPPESQAHVVADQVVADDEIAAEFEAALAAGSEEIVPDGQAGEYHPAPQQNGSNELTMPPVQTPFDNQVDTALDQLQAESHATDSELGWSGELADELEEIVVASDPGYEDDGLDNLESEAAGEADTQPEAAETTVGSSLHSSDDVQMQPAEIRAHMQAFEQEFSSQPDISDGLNDRPQEGVTPELAAMGTKSAGGNGGMKVAAVVLGIAVLGGGAAFGWNYMGGGGKTGEPARIVMASSEPVKVKPEEPGGKEIPNQDQVVFEKVQGGSELKSDQTTLASATEKPIRVVSTNLDGNVPPVAEKSLVPGRNLSAVANQNSPAAGRVVTGSDQPEPVDTKSAARISADDNALKRTESAIVSPRKVRTVTVRPDGTIVLAEVKKPDSNSSATVAENVPVELGLEKQLASALDDGVAGFARSINIGEPVAVNKPSGESQATNTTGTVSKSQPFDGGTSATGEIIAPTANPVPRPVAAAPKPIQTPKRAVTGSARNVAKPKQAPVNRTSPAPAVRTASVGSYVMQVSSQRSAEAAQVSYNRLNRRFGSILGGRGVDIRRFNVAKKGIYYRVRIPVGSRRDAINLCQRYKKAGGSCFVTR